MQQHGQLGVTEWNIFLVDFSGGIFRREHRDYFTEREETLVDLTRLLSHDALRLRLLKTLATGEVNEADLAVLLEHVIIIILSFADQVHRQYGMTTRRILVEIMRACVTVFDTFMHDRDQVLDARALDNHQVLHKETIFSVPARMQDTRRRVQEIAQLFVVDFQE